MSISTRLSRLEQTRARAASTPAEQKAFWDEHLTLLSDAQLDRFEEIFLKYAADDPATDDRRLPEIIVDIADDERADMMAIWVTMGLNPDEWS
ncbi:hypothetical protein [Devosia sp. SD17-2]|uniref:hypothetical protein n=1 Tax=Devosia sp. SD17-2 TaxID=2976459 RepID=UPI0023D7FF43|nr:hypothetical protein [Devosia sp. SD17-2]WEJ31993.1 hypothetical protein NYQ88_13900 [Devosia sp. SD17-2]